MIPTANRELRTVNCRYEQAVYGSFPFRGEGYAPLAHSPGCRPEWLDAFHAACRSIGEKPRGAGDISGMLFALRITGRGPWMIVGVSSPGADDRGRPDALAFHALFVEKAEFRKVGYSPFAMTSALREDWGSDTTLDPGSVVVPATIPRTFMPDAPAVASALARGRKVAIASGSPIVDLAREVWNLLPHRDRERCSVATWAFANGPRFDLVAAPSLAGWELDGAYVDPFAEPITPPRRSIRRGLIVAGVVCLAALGASRWWTSGRAELPFAPASPQDRPIGDEDGPLWASTPILREKDRSPGPDLASYPDRDPGPDDSPEVRDRLSTFTDMFVIGLNNRDPFTGEQGGGLLDERDDKIIYMRRIHAWRYAGPLLTHEELATIARSSAEGRSRALAWDRHIRHFVADRPLPPDFAEGPLRWRIDTLAWSFHLEPNPLLTASEAVDAISDALKLDEPIAANPLEAKYPALAEYARFLGRLPMR